MNLRIISPARRGEGNEETWQAKAQKNRFIIEIHVISHLLLLSVADCQCVRPLYSSGSGQTHSSLGTCIFLVTVGAGAVAEVGAEVEVDVRRCRLRLCASKVQVRSN